MPVPASPSLAELFVPAGLLDVSDTGIIHFRPVFAPGDATRPVDLHYLRLNPTAQRLLRLPEFPTNTFLTLSPGDTAAFEFYRDAFVAGEVRTRALAHPSGWQARAQRHGPQLVVSLTALAGPGAAPPGPAVAARRAASEAALARAQLAAQELAQERDALRQLLAQTPAAICLLRGPEYRFEYVNPAFAQLFAHRALLGMPAAGVLPEALNQGFITLLDRVYDTGETLLEAEMPLASPAGGGIRYFNFTYQAHLEDGHADRLSVFAYDVTGQVLARRQVQQLNDDLLTTNEELRANVAKLASAQQQLQHLNEALEGRVAAGVQEARLAHAEAEDQRRRLARFFEQAPAAVCVLDGPGLVYELVNPVYQRYFSGRPLLGQPVQAVPELSEQDIPAILRQVYDTGVTHEGHEVQLWLRPTDGPPQEVSFNCVYQARHDEQGRVDGVFVFAYDVTEQVLARRQVQQLNDELEARVAERTQQLQAARAATEAQRQQLATLIRLAPVAISYVEGPDLRLRAINALACQLWHTTEAAALGQPLLDALPQLRGQGFEQLLLDCLRTQQPFMGQEVAIAVQPQGTASQYFNFVYQPLASAGGEPGILTVAVDVTGQVLARQQVQQLNDELEARVAERTQQLQAALHEAEQQRGHLCEQQGLLRQILSQLPAAVATLAGPEQRFVFFNDNYQDLVGGRARLGQTVADLLPELVAQGFGKILDEVYTTGQLYQGHRQVVQLAEPAAGPAAPRYVDFQYQPLKNAHGQPQGILAFIVDVTEQVLAQQRTEALQAEVQATARRQAHEREAFYQVFAQTPAIVALLRAPDYQLTYANPAFERLFPGRALLGLPVGQALPEAVARGFVARLDQVCQTGAPYFTTEVPLTIAQFDDQLAKVIYLDLTLQAYQEGGRTVGVSVFAFDVSEQVRARQQREAARHQLQTVFEQAPVALALLTGPTYVVEVASPIICALWGRHQAQVLGRPLFEVLPKAASPGLPELLAEVRRTGVARVVPEHPCRRQGHAEMAYFHFVYQPITNAQGQVAAVAVVATDVSTRVAGRQQLARANEELRASNEQLTRTNVDLDNFIYTASHDLKAPIANIESLLALLRQQLPAEARQAGLVPRVLGMMQGAIERFQLTIAQLTDLAQLHQAHAGPPETADLAAAVEAVRLDLAPELEATGGHLTVKLAPGATVPLAPQHLRSVVYNLLSNALKYHHPDRLPAVRLRGYAEAGISYLTVEDNGLGLSEEQQSKLFGLFRRLHAHVGGSGVGLYLVKRMVENAGGTITVRSQLGIGSTFIVAFPS